ncbi:hypothetical protein CN425_21130 [Bacillus cereus]|uniref:Uncharacterized protein n=1 Tax=Bacillus cereus TaxID=1396 RepID=A0A2A8PS38_BACCE|nr:hypothetical protein CN425_21130 [Bacillus cereus]
MFSIKNLKPSQIQFILKCYVYSIYTSGDVNGDKGINSKNAEIIANNYGKKGVSVKDGIVNEKITYKSTLFENRVLFSINNPYPAKGVYWGYTRETGKGIYIKLYKVKL